jgi:hypothetical protein
MLKKLAILLLLGAVCWQGCKNEDTCGCGSRQFEPELAAEVAPFPGAWAELVANHDPAYGGTAKLTFRYEFQESAALCDTVTLIARGYFEPSVPGVFSYESGESSWVDTVRCFERREHSVTIRAQRKRQLLIQAFVGAPVDELRSFGGTDNICLCVK